MNRISLLRLLSLLTHPVVVFVTLPWVMFLLVAGTIAQRNLGLYEATSRYLTSFVVWFGPVPVPGMYVALGIISFCLLLKLAFKSPWRKLSAGTVITHIGALMLLFGALLTALTSEEGYMTIGEGETKHTLSDYFQRELVILKDEEELFSYPLETLQKGQELATNLPFSIKLDSFCQNCRPLPRDKATDEYKGVAQKIVLHPIRLRKENEENLFGAELHVSGAGEGNGIYVAFELTPHQPSFVFEDHEYTMAARRVQRSLPFTVTLDSFQKFTYPGSQTAQEYESVVTITDGELSWQSAIRMNEPIRHHGYTFYQSSYLEANGKQFSVLAVVKNSGRVFPYVSSIVMCIGLIVMLVMRRKKKGAAS